jgi:hypothetical protein
VYLVDESFIFKKKGFFFKVSGLEKQRDMGRPLMDGPSTNKGGGGSKRITGVNIAKSKSHPLIGYHASVLSVTGIKASKAL